MIPTDYRKVEYRSYLEGWHDAVIRIGSPADRALKGEAGKTFDYLRNVYREKTS